MPNGAHDISILEKTFGEMRSHTFTTARNNDVSHVLAIAINKA